MRKSEPSIHLLYVRINFLCVCFEFPTNAKLKTRTYSNFDCNSMIQGFKFTFCRKEKWKLIHTIWLLIDQYINKSRLIRFPAKTGHCLPSQFHLKYFFRFSIVFSAWNSSFVIIWTWPALNNGGHLTTPRAARSLSLITNLLTTNSSTKINLMNSAWYFMGNVAFWHLSMRSGARIWNIEPGLCKVAF